MSIWDSLFGRDNESPTSQLTFGRYSDSQKSSLRYDHWDQALQAYEDGVYLSNFKHILEFLKDDKEANLSYTEQKGKLTFQFYQGSKLIRGTADRIRLRAEAKIALSSNIDLSLAQRLISQNFGLKYCRFALCDEGDICIIFDTYAVDASPYKIYNAFKELAAKADKYDDVLIAQYNFLSKVDDNHITPITQREKDLKYNYTRSLIDGALKIIHGDQSHIQKYPSAICYIVLDIIYKIDYLVKPEGTTMDMIEEIHRTYLHARGSDIWTKNQKVVKLLKGWLQRPKSDFDGEIYNVISTFGVTIPSSHDKLAECIDSELPKMDWFYDNKYDHVALAVPSYLVGYLLFSYALPDPDKDYLHLLYEILESDYFSDMGFTNTFFKKGILNQSQIKKRIIKIKKKQELLYPQLDPQIKSLDFTNMMTFSKSYLLMVRNLDMHKIDPRDVQK